MSPRRRLALISCLLIGLAWLALYAAQFGARLWQGGNDFLQLYAGGSLAGTSRLYDAEAAWHVHTQAVGYHLPAVAFARPPFYAWLLEPLARLPYLWAYWLFMAANLSCLAWFCWRYFKDDPWAALLASCFPPLFIAILGGNDLGLILGVLGGAVLLMEKRRDFAAGLLLSLCAIKFHLFLLLPPVLWILGRKRVVAGGTAGGAALTALSFLVQGLDWPRHYVELLRNPLIHPDIQAMPNLHGMMRAAAPGAALQATVAASLCVAAAVLWLAWRDRRNWQAGIAYAALGSLLVSWHSYQPDAVLLLFVLAILRRSSNPAAVQLPLAVAFVPLTFWMLNASPPWSTLPPTLMCLILGGAVWTAGRRAGSAPDALSEECAA